LRPGFDSQLEYNHNELTTLSLPLTANTTKGEYEILLTEKSPMPELPTLANHLIQNCMPYQIIYYEIAYREIAYLTKSPTYIHVRLCDLVR